MLAPIDPRQPARVLLLGGTSEAVQLATMLAPIMNLTVITSLAGRVAQPRLPDGLVRVGGFGGVDGFTSYLREESISAVLDVTHPFAAQISRNAAQACSNLALPLLTFERPQWTPVEGDRWTHVADVPEAASFVARKLVAGGKARIFLSIGRQELAAFAQCEEPWFLIRSIDRPVDPLPLRSKIILDRGPFDLVAESKMLREQSIDLVITKNSGGSATYPKVAAARELKIDVLMIDRPQRPWIAPISDLAELVDILLQTLDSRFANRSRNTL